MAELRGVGRMTMKGEARLTIGLGAETWQFWAFVFGALASLAFSLIDEIGIVAWPLGWRLVLKGGVFGVLAIGTYLVGWWLRAWPLQKLTTDSR